jgi:hypothetical protein
MNKPYIIVQIKNVYGKEVVYPICDKAKLFCKLAGTKTLVENAQCTILDLGYMILTDKHPIARDEKGWSYEA